MGSIEIRYSAGLEFVDVISDMRRISSLLSCSVESTVNGVKVHVMGDKMPIEEAAKKLKYRIQEYMTCRTTNNHLIID